MTLHPAAVLQKVRKRTSEKFEANSLIIHVPGENSTKGTIHIDRESGIVDRFLIDPGNGIGWAELAFVAPGNDAISLDAEQALALEADTPVTSALLAYLRQVPDVYAATHAIGLVTDADFAAEHARRAAFIDQWLPLAAVILPVVEAKLTAMITADKSDLLPFGGMPEQNDPSQVMQQTMLTAGLAMNMFLEPHLDYQGWPLTALRESLMVVGGNARTTGPELGRLANSPNMGPIGSLVIAQLLRTAGYSGPASGFAQRGLQHLHAAGFNTDIDAWRPVLSPLLTWILETQQADAPIADLGPTIGPQLQAALATAAQEQSDPLDSIASLCWENGLADSVEAALHAIIDSLTPAAPSPPQVTDDDVEDPL